MLVSLSSSAQFREMMTGRDAVNEQTIYKGIKAIYQKETAGVISGDSILQGQLLGTACLTYNADGKLTGRDEYYKTDPTTPYLRDHLDAAYYYDKNGNLLMKEECISGQSVGGRWVTNYSYEFDKEGRMKTRQIIETFSNFSTKKIERYNAKGQIYACDIYDKKGNMASAARFFYGEKGNDIRDSVTEWGGETATITITTTTYNSHNDPVTFQYVDNGELRMKGRYEYEYSKEGHWTKRAICIDGQPVCIDELEYVKN